MYMVQFRLLFTMLRHFEKIWHAPFFFESIGHHLESVGQTELIFELNLAPNEKRPTYGHFFLSSYRVNIAIATYVPRQRSKVT